MAAHHLRDDRGSSGATSGYGSSGIGGAGSATFTRVTFTVRAETHPGQKVHLTGDNARLGSFKANRAMELVTTPDEYPIWRTPRPLMLPTGNITQYKYVLFSGGEFEMWEPILAHARVICPMGHEVVQDDTFGVCEESDPHAAVREVIGDVQVNDFDTESDSASTASASTAPYAEVPAYVHHLAANSGSSVGGVVGCVGGGGAAGGGGGASSTSALLGGDATSTPLTAAEDAARRLSMRIFIVSFHLPVVLMRDAATGEWRAKWNRDNLIAKTEASVAEDHTVVWVGGVTPHCVKGLECSPFDFDEATKNEIVAVLRPMSCVPVFLESTVYEQHYSRFCKKTLWKVFHNVLDVNDALGDVLEGEAVHTAFDGYVKLNRQLADAVLARLEGSEQRERDAESELRGEREREGEGEDTFALPRTLNCVWVHDYHLMLVPEMLTNEAGLAEREAGVLLERPRVVFFMHLPFPTSEIFRTLSMRSRLLDALLCADVVGFHTFDHARHFLTACKRFLGFKHQMRKGGTLCVDKTGHAVMIAVSHVGVEPRRLERVLSSSGVVAAARAIRERHTDKVIVAGLDELQRLKGVPLKLLAFEQLLHEYPRFREEVVLVQWCVETGKEGRVNDLAKSSSEVKELIKRIITQFGPVVDYVQWPASSPPTLDDRVSLWMAADVMISTPVMEGLNLMPLEYQFCHREPAGVVIVSEFSACSRVLNGALRVNCYDASRIAKALDQAIVMPKREREARRSRDFEYISERPSSVWTRNVLELAMPKSAEDNVFTAIMNDHYQTEATLENQVASNMPCPVSRPHTMDMAECVELDLTSVVAAYRSTRRRMVILDYGGTIVPREKQNVTMKRGFFGVSKSKISRNMMTTLKNLATDPDTCLCIVSGNARRVLSDAFQEVINTPGARLAIVAHSGLCIRWVGNHELERRFMANDAREERSNSSLAAADSSAEGSTVPATTPPPQLESSPQPSGRSLDDGGSAATSSVRGEAAKTAPAASSSATGGRRVRHRGGSQHEEAWETMLRGVSDEWGEWMEAANVPEIMDEYTARTGGSVWRQTSVTTTWDYRHADPEWGDMQANHLQTTLEAAVQAINLPVMVLRKMNIVQLLPKGVSKGTAVRHILERLPTFTGWGENSGPDFALCVGDDLADELMYTELMGALGESAAAHKFRLFHHGPKNLEKGEALRDVYTVTVGRKPTEARYYVRDASEVGRTLSALVADAADS